MDTAKENELCLQFHVYRKKQCSVNSFKPRYPTVKPEVTGYRVTSEREAAANRSIPHFSRQEFLSRFTF